MDRVSENATILMGMLGDEVSSMITLSQTFLPFLGTYSNLR
jgi:hypothetical protein